MVGGQLPSQNDSFCCCALIDVTRIQDYEIYMVPNRYLFFLGYNYMFER